MYPTQSFDFEFAGAHYHVEPIVHVDKERQTLHWHLFRDGFGLTFIALVPEEPRDSVQVRFARWLDDHLLEFTYRGQTYQIVKTETAEQIRNHVKHAPEAWWYVTRGPDYVCQFPVEKGQTWDHARRLLIQYVHSHPSIG